MDKKENLKIFKTLIKGDSTYTAFFESMVSDLLEERITKERAVDIFKALIGQIHEPIREKILVKALYCYLSDGEGIIVNVEDSTFLMCSIGNHVRCYPLDESLIKKDKKLTDGLLVCNVVERQDGSVTFSEVPTS